MKRVGDEDLDRAGEAACTAALFEPDHLTERELARLMDVLADAVVIVGVDGTILLWNDAATRLFGFDAADAIGASLDLIIPERFRERHWTGWHATMASGHTSYGDRLLTVPALHRDGRKLSIAFTITLLCAPGSRLPYAAVAVIRDDTERWQEHRRLVQELESLRAGARAAE